MAPSIDATTSLVIDYLSRKHSLPINAVSFDVVSAGAEQILVRHAVVDEATITPPPGARRRTRTEPEMRAYAEENGVGEIVRELETVRDLLPFVSFYLSSFALRGRTLDKRYVSGVTIYPGKDTNPGSVVIGLSFDNLGALYGYAVEDAEAWVTHLSDLLEPVPTNWLGWARVRAHTVEQAAEFVRRLRSFAAAGNKQLVPSVSAPPPDATPTDAPPDG